MTLTRYEPDNPLDSAPSMKECADGDWVRYRDVAGEINRLEALLRSARAQAADRQRQANETLETCRMWERRAAEYRAAFTAKEDAA